MRVRLKSPGGTTTLTLADDSTIGDLIDQIVEKSAVAYFDVKYGYPPKPLLLLEDRRSYLLTSLDVKLNNETIIVSPKESASADAGVVSEQQKVHSILPAKTTRIEKEPAASVSFPGMKSEEPKQKPVSLKKKPMADEVPELPLPEYGATMSQSSLSALQSDAKCN